MAASSSSSLPPSPPVSREFDVFLSFRGEDTRKTFVGHLYRALDQRGIRTFKDDEKLERGKSISPELLKKIKASRIGLIVFSKNYANSPWCLDELVEILECSRRADLRQTVLPIFYHVKPWEVRHQKGSFEEAFTEHEKKEMERVQRWRADLKDAANIGGLDLQDAANGDEAKFIQLIVQEISRQLPPTPLSVAKYGGVGIDSRAKKVIKLLNERSEDNLFVGIWGTGGIGKTTVAKAVFNQMSKEFERSCFLGNVREESTKQDGSISQVGLAKLQQKLLRKTLMDNSLEISDSDQGKTEIKAKLGHKKILLVLDDVNHEEQLESLAGIRENWFGSGSKIIIATRDERLLSNYHIETYKAEILDYEEALKLFSRHAFQQDNPLEIYQELSYSVTYYAKGLPLALQVLGSLLGNRSIDVWKSELDKLKSHPPKGIQDVLKISYDSLDKKEKDIFLDIACFFKGYQKEFAERIFESCGFYPVTGLKVLTERSLITVSEGNELEMHDLIQEMGREIVRQECENPGKRTRLWTYEDIYEVFTEKTVTKNIEAIMLPEEGVSLEGIDYSEGGLSVSPDAFAKMKKLRILKISGVQLDGRLTYLSKELRYLDWSGHPAEYLPDNFCPKELVYLKLHNSMTKGIWTNKKVIKMLKFVDLSYCKDLVETLNFPQLPCLVELQLNKCESLVEVKFDEMKSLKFINLNACENLKKTPNLSVLPCLEILYFVNCTSLAEFHPSIEFHGRLVELDFHGCKNLKSPKRIHLKSLKSIQLACCSKLEEFPEIEGDMECLEELDLSDTAIIELSPSVAKHLKGLQELRMGKCKMLKRLGDNIPQSVEYLKGLGSLPSNIGEMKSLDYLVLSGSGIKKLPSSFALLTRLTVLRCDDCNLDEESILNLPHSLRDLDLRRNKVARLPASFTQLTSLESLYLDGCLGLQTLDSLPSSLRKVSAQGCSALERYSIPKCISDGQELNFAAQGCSALDLYSIPHCEFISDGQELNFAECHKLVVNDGKNKPNIYNSDSELQGIHQIIVPGSEIPSWFSHTYESGSEEGMTTPVVCLCSEDPNSFDHLKGVYVCAVFGSNQQEGFYSTLSLRIKGKSEKVYAYECGFTTGWDHKSRDAFIEYDHMRLFHISRDTFIEYDRMMWLNRIIEYDWKCNYDGCFIQASFEAPLKKWGIHPEMDATQHTGFRDPLSLSTMWAFKEYKRRREHSEEDSDYENPPPPPPPPPHHHSKNIKRRLGHSVKIKTVDSDDEDEDEDDDDDENADAEDEDEDEDADAEDEDEDEDEDEEDEDEDNDE